MAHRLHARTDTHSEDQLTAGAEETIHRGWNEDRVEAVHGRKVREQSVGHPHRDVDDPLLTRTKASQKQK